MYSLTVIKGYVTISATEPPIAPAMPSMRASGADIVPPSPLSAFKIIKNFMKFMSEYEKVPYGKSTPMSWNSGSV